MKMDKGVFETLALISQLGLSMIVPIVLCTYVGVWLEGKVTFPFTIIFIILGILAGVRNVYALLKKYLKKESEEEDGEK
jgi:uncharacterized membrane protein SirB2